MQGNAGHKTLRAIAEVVVVAAAYIAISTTAVGISDVSQPFPATWSPDAKSTGRGS
jgi:hypothetical protein